MPRRNLTTKLATTGFIMKTLPPKKNSKSVKFARISWELSSIYLMMETNPLKKPTLMILEESYVLANMNKTFLDQKDQEKSRFSCLKLWRMEINTLGDTIRVQIKQ